MDNKLPDMVLDKDNDSQEVPKIIPHHVITFPLDLAQDSFTEIPLFS
ncbi:hypothetical protein [Ectobacillus panaciterrae]